MSVMTTHADDSIANDDANATAATAHSIAPAPKPKTKGTYIKIGISVAIAALIIVKVATRDGLSDVVQSIRNANPAWIALGFATQLAAIFCSVFRWKLLLKGQGIHAPFRHVLGAFWIGRYFGTVAPGGWTGLDAYRIYDISSHTGKTARATATVVVDKLIGQIAFGTVVVLCSPFGVPFFDAPGRPGSGWKVVGLIDAAFISLIAAVITFLVKPGLLRKVSARLPAPIRARMSSFVEALSAYRGRGGLVLAAYGLSIGTHALTSAITVAVAHALGAPVGVGAVFFVATMAVLATLAPISVNGIGIREGVSVALFSRVGVAASTSLLFPIGFFLIDVIASAFGVVFLQSRRTRYTPNIVVDDPDRERALEASIENVPDSELPNVWRATILGACGGMLGGAMIGLAEGALTLVSAGGSISTRDMSFALTYGVAVYAILGKLGGAGAALSLAFLKRSVRLSAATESRTFARSFAMMFAALAFALGAFRVQRDVFHELLKWKSMRGVGVMLGCMLAAAVVYLALSAGVRWAADRSRGFVLRAWFAPALLSVIALAAASPMIALGRANPAASLPVAKPTAPSAGPVIVIVVDTLRADHLPGYGYEKGNTPNLAAFGRDAIRFQSAFANASWTRPSFATIMTGRYPSNHRTMDKSASLPAEVTTLAEAFGSAGYRTVGFVTNYNVAPFFRFDQGFDLYRYLEPNFVLGANDTAAKFLAVQFARQRIESMRAATGRVEAGSAYQDAAHVNREIFGWLDRTKQDAAGCSSRPCAADAWLMFVGYMDPHDPYFPHPYDGTGYSRAAHQKPALDEAAHLERLYDGEITYWDQNFGELVARLKADGIYDDATILVTSDHGEEFGEHGGFWHGTTLYDEQVHIPLFLKLPQNDRGGSVVAHWVEHVDLLPTLARLAGIEMPGGIQGRDLFEGRTEVYAEESHEGNVLNALRLQRGGQELKLITANPENPRGLEAVELYRLDQDPGERVSLTTELPRERDLVAKHLVDAESRSEEGRARATSVDVTTEPGAAERLRALGYAGH